MANDARYVTLTDDNFESEVLQSDVPVMVDFWAEWCGPCRIIAPMVEELSKEFDGENKARAKIAKMDIDQNPKVPMQYGVRSIPTLLFFKDGRVVDQLIGAAPKRALAARLDALTAQEA